MDSYENKAADDNPYRSPMASQFEDQTAAAPNQYDSIGGWLILPAIGLVLAPFIRIFSIIMSVGAFSNLAVGMQGLQMVIIIECLCNTIMLAWGIWAAILFFQKKAAAPRAMIILFSGNILVSILDWMMIASLSNVPVEAQTSVVADAFKALVIGGIWIWYFCVSKRVKGTFVQ